jgi:hypothetical protein
MFIGRKHVYRAEAGEADGGGADVVETVDPADNTDTPDIEAEARKMGWTPKAEFRGDPDKWRGADEFVERGRNMLPIVRATVKKQEREIADLKASMKQFAEFHDKTEQRAYAQALSDLKEQRAQAIAAGDGAAFDKVDDAIDSLKKDIAIKTAKPATDDADPVFNDWKDRNKWLDDPKMEAFGNAAANYLRSTGEKATGADFLELVTKEVKAKFPDKFENPRRSAAPAVEGGAPAARGKAGQSFADMPAEARNACERMARNAYADKPKEAAAFKAQYTKTYFEE